MTALKQMNFHEATVVAFRRSDSAVMLELEDVLVGGAKSNVALRISPVYSLSIDDEPHDGEELLEYDDGEVLSLEMSDECVVLNVEWNDFSSGASCTKSYKILAGGISVLIE